MSRCCVIWRRAKRALYRVAEMEGVGRDRLWRVTKEMFLEWQEAHRRAHNRVDFQAYDALPHITRGDLCHLSGTGGNTGAGRGEIPHDEWVGRIGGPKAINSSVYGITLAAFNR